MCTSSTVIRFELRKSDLKYTFGACYELCKTKRAPLQALKKVFGGMNNWNEDHDILYKYNLFFIKKFYNECLIFAMPRQNEYLRLSYSCDNSHKMRLKLKIKY